MKIQKIKPQTKHRIAYEHESFVIDCIEAAEFHFHIQDDSPKTTPIITNGGWINPLTGEIVLSGEVSRSSHAYCILK